MTSEFSLKKKTDTKFFCKEKIASFVWQMKPAVSRIEESIPVQVQQLFKIFDLSLCEPV